MKKWKEECNYRRIKDENGVVTANVIYINGTAIEVSKEIYDAYAQMGRRERYIEEKIQKIPHISFEKLMDASVPIELYTPLKEPSAESVFLKAIDEAEHDDIMRRLSEAMKMLNNEERALLFALYFEGVSTREYAKRCGVYQRTITYRRDQILKKLKLILNKNE